MFVKVYHMLSKITKKKWYIVDPRSSKLIPYWDAIGMVRKLQSCSCSGPRDPQAGFRARSVV